MKLPTEYLAMLEDHCEKLEVVEAILCEKFLQTQDREDALAWLTAQQQLRLTAIELMRNQHAEPSEKPRSNAEKRQAISNQPTQTSTQLIAAAKA